MFSDESELAEIREIEEGFKKAYDGDAKGTVEAVDKLRDFAVRLIYLNATAENDLDVKALMIAIRDIGRVAAERRMELVCMATSRALVDVVVEAAGKEREPLAVKALSLLGSLALEFAETGMDTAAKGAAEFLGDCGKFSSKRKMETLVSLAEVYLMQLAMKALDKNLSEIGSASIGLLGEIGASSAEQTLENSTTETAILLEDLGNTAVIKKDEVYAKAVIQALGNLGTTVSHYDLKNSLIQTAWSLETIRVLAQEQGLKTACLEAKAVLESLNTAGMLDEEQNLERIQEIKTFHHRILKKN